jgi:crotonobetainyl-CoA:carnitine CoA-transferase CaiB-like acyl-CoA transferase
MTITTPLQGIKVLDMSRVLAGPWAGQMLADLGADVIKVERPGMGDDTRAWGPPYMPAAAGFEAADASEAAYFQAANRGKRSLCVDIATVEGQNLIKRLAAQADVLIENFKVGSLAKYGLDFERLTALNPRLVYCSITGFGQTGPYKDRAGYDFMIQAMGGLMSVTGSEDGEPMKVGVALADIMTGLYASNAIQGALIYQLRTGQGQHIDLALLDVQVASLANQAMNYLATGHNPKRLGNAHPNIVPYQAFATADGHLILAVGNDAQFERFCQVAGAQELASDPQYQTNALRVANRSVLVPIVMQLLKQHATVWWLSQLNTVGVPCGPICTLDQVFDNPQVQAREMQIALNHEQLGTVSSVANPIKLSATPLQYTQAPPMLGQHTQAVLRDWLAMEEPEYTALLNAQVIA